MIINTIYQVTLIEDNYLLFLFIV